LLLATTESRNARAKLKIRGYPAETTQPHGHYLFLACSNWDPQNACRFVAKKMVAKALDFAKQKGNEKDILDCFVTSFLVMAKKIESSYHFIFYIQIKSFCFLDSHLRGNDGK
jgi:hypothetical protein